MPLVNNSVVQETKHCTKALHILSFEESSYWDEQHLLFLRLNPEILACDCHMNFTGPPDAAAVGETKRH